MKLKYLAIVLLLVGLMLLAAPVLQAQETPPSLPALCYGELTVNGQPAPVGTRVTAKVDGALAGEIVTEEAGWYGGPGLKSKLTVGGDDLQGKMVRFYISGTANGTEYDDVFAGEEPYWGSGEVKQINLGVRDVESTPAPDPPPEPPDADPPPDAEEEPELTEDEEAEEDAQEAAEEEAEEPEPVEEEAADDPEDLEQDTASGVLSNGWTIAAVVIIAAVLVTLVAGYLIRRPGAKKKIQDKE